VIFERDQGPWKQKKPGPKNRRCESRPGGRSTKKKREKKKKQEENQCEPGEALKKSTEIGQGPTNHFCFVKKNQRSEDSSPRISGRKEIPERTKKRKGSMA